MPISVKHVGVWKEAEVHVKHQGIWKRAEVWVKQSGIWKLAGEVASAIVHTLSPASAVLFSAAPGRTFALSSVVTGGTPSSYSWGFISSSGGSWSLSTPTASTTNLTVSGVANQVQAIAEVYCDAIVGGVTYRATGTYRHTNITIQL